MDDCWAKTNQMCKQVSIWNLCKSRVKKEVDTLMNMVVSDDKIYSSNMEQLNGRIHINNENKSDDVMIGDTELSYWFHLFENSITNIGCYDDDYRQCSIESSHISYSQETCVNQATTNVIESVTMRE